MRDWNLLTPIISAGKMRENGVSFFEAWEGLASELRDSSGNYLFTKDPAAEPPCCQQWGLAVKPETGTSWPLVYSGLEGCRGGHTRTAQEWMDSLANSLLGGDTYGAEGICLADGYYTISYDPAL